MFKFFQPKLIVGKAVKITQELLVDPEVIKHIKSYDPYFWEGRLQTLEEYFQLNDYLLIFDDTITVVPANEFFVYFVFTDDEIAGEFRPVRQIKEF
jgi:hypothetical protein